ncbi:hypothetical protein E2C06_34285, partial [Dankookia rubra]
PRELAVRFTDRERYFVSEASVYRLLKAHDLITSPAFITTSLDRVLTDKPKGGSLTPDQLPPQLGGAPLVTSSAADGDHLVRPT